MILGGLFSRIDGGGLGISLGQVLSECPRFSGVGDSGVSGIGCICWQSCIGFLRLGGVCSVYCSGFPIIGVGSIES